MDHDLGTAIGANVHSATTEGASDDYALMACAKSGGGGGFVVDPPQDADDYVIAWTFPETGSYLVETTDAVLGVAPANCEAEIDSCDDACFGPGTVLVLEGRAGDTVHLIVETIPDPEAFSLSIQPGSSPTCEDEGGSSGGR